MTSLKQYVQGELDQFRSARAAGDKAAAWAALERAHILSQPSAWLHTRVHVAMLSYGAALGDGREVWGQVVRTAVAGIGSLLNRAPVGNTGRAHVPIMQVMPVPADIQAKLDGAQATVRR